MMIPAPIISNKSVTKINAMPACRLCMRILSFTYVEFAAEKHFDEFGLNATPAIADADHRRRHASMAIDHVAEICSPFRDHQRTVGIDGIAMIVRLNQVAYPIAF